MHNRIRIGVAAIALFVGALASNRTVAGDAPPLMTVPGQFAVGPSGAATYSIPIVVPPGTMGMVPSVSLDYSSQGGDGIVGFGFGLSIGLRPADPVRGQGQRLNDSPSGFADMTTVREPAGGGVLGKGQLTSGLPQISRCAQTIAQDGTHGGVHLDANDRFCLNGERLVVINGGTYGADGSEYRTEIDGFARVRAHGNAGSGPAWFDVRLKSGVTLEFGNTTSSRILAVGTSTVRAWALNKAVDSKGNYLTISYTNDTTHGQFYPDRVDYTGNDTASLTAYNSVRFVYDMARPDAAPMYQAGSLQQTTVLLTDIKTYQGSNLVLDYKLAYRAGSSTTRSRLTSVTQCDANNACLAPTTFTWQGGNGLGTKTAVTYAVTYGAYSFADAPDNIGDFNGDGLTDYLSATILGLVQLGTQTPGAFTSSSMTRTDGGTVTSPAYFFLPYGARAAGDFTGSGFTSVVLGWDYVTPYKVYVNDTHGNFNAVAPPSLSAICCGQLAVAGDFNGDGRRDLLSWNGYFSQSWSCGSCDGAFVLYLSNGDGTFTADASRTINTTGYPATSVRYVNTADYGGTGCGDMLMNNTSGAMIVYGCGGGTVTFPGLSLGGMGGGTIYGATYGDYNGDGKTDAAVASASTGLYTIQLSTGNSFVQADTLPTDCGGAPGGDFNGDGRDDFICTQLDTGTMIATWKIYLSTGTGVVDSGQSVSFSVNTGESPQLADFNSDGIPDIVLPVAATFSHFSYAPELVTAISNGIGATTTIAYDRINKNAPFYTKGTDAAYPMQDVDGPIYAVKQVDSSNGIGGIFTTTYAYAGAKRNLAGRGFLGFSSVTATDAQTGIVTTTTYRMDFPYAGMVATRSSVTTQTRNGCTAGVTLNAVANSYSAPTPSVPASPLLVKLDQTVASGHDCDGTTLPTTTTAYTYDSYGNATQVSASVSDGSSSVVNNTYNNDATNWLFTLAGAATTNTVGASTITRATTFAYQSGTDFITQKIDEPSNSSLKVQVDYTLDAFGNPTATSTSGPTFATCTLSATYTSNGAFMASLTNCLNQTRYFANDPKFGGLLTYTDLNALQTSWTYDGFGRKTLELRPDGTRTTYQITDNVTCSAMFPLLPICPPGTMPYVWERWVGTNGSTKTAPWIIRTYDSLLRPFAVFETRSVGWAVVSFPVYDGAGNIQKAPRPFTYGSGSPVWTTFTYDDLGRVTQSVAPFSGSTNATTTYAYHGLSSSVTNDKGQTTTVVRNAQGLNASVTDALSHAIGHVYDAFGNLKTVTDPSGNVASNTYDARGRRTASSDPDMGAWSYTYDGLGRLLTQVDAKSQTTTLSYDLLGRLTQRAEPGLTSTWTWDSATNGVGLLAAAATNNGYSRAIAYDALGRPSVVTLTLDGTGYTYTAGYVAITGLLDTLAYPSGLTVKYVYSNATAQVSQLKDNASGSVLWTINTKDAEDHLLQQTAGNGVVTTQTFDAYTGLPTNVRAGPSDAVAAFDYAYDSIGRLIYRSDNYHGVFERFCHDDLNRMTKSALGLGSDPGTSCTSPGGTVKTLGYDALGNITSKSDVGTYSYPAGGSARPHAVSSIAGTVNGVTNPSYTYDANGNLIAGAGRSVAYTSFNMAATITQGTTVASFAYDADHARMKMAVGSSTTYYAADLGGMAERIVAGSSSTWHDYLNVDGRIVAMRASGTPGTSWRYFVSDHLGSAASVTDGAGAVVERDAYDPWGKRRNLNGSDDATCSLASLTTRGYTGHEHIDAQCLINMNARVYDPTLGRFMTPDTFVSDPSNLQDWNAYTYVNNRPLTLTDPSGHTGVGCAVGGVAGGLAGAGVGAVPGCVAGEVIETGLEMAVAALAAVAITAGGAVVIANGTKPTSDGSNGQSNNANQDNSRQGGSKPPDPNKTTPPPGAQSGRAEPHGNSLESTRPQHRYEISQKSNGDVVKTGISGEPVNQNGTSGRANIQVNALNRTAGTTKYEARVVETNLAGRQAALESERAATTNLARSGNSLELQIRPTPKPEP